VIDTFIVYFSLGQDNSYYNVSCRYLATIYLHKWIPSPHQSDIQDISPVSPALDPHGSATHLTPRTSVTMHMFALRICLVLI